MSMDYEIVYDMTGAARVVWSEDHPSMVADRELLAALDRHPRWQQRARTAPAQQPSATASPA